MRASYKLPIGLRVPAGLTLGLLLTVSACTSSNTPTGLQTNAGYDQGYRAPTQGSTQYDDGKEVKTSSEPVYTLMELATETGDIYPGEEYAVYAVADSPDERGHLEYVWSCTNGTLAELPEADRGRIQTLIEGDDAAIRSGQLSDEPKAGEGEPPAGEVPVPAPGVDAGATPGVVGEPGAAGQPSVTPGPAATDGSGGAVAGSGTAAPPATKKTVNDLTAEQKTYPTNIQNLLVKNLNGETLTPDEGITLQQFIAAQNTKAGSAGSARLMQNRFVGSPRATADNAAHKVGESGPAPSSSPRDAKAIAGEALDAARDELDRFRGAPSAAENVADSSAGAHGDFAGEESASTSSERGLRDQYEAWSDDSTDPRRRTLGGVDEGDADEPLAAEESYEASTFVTDTPYVLWTPARPGITKLYCKLVWKEVDLTDPVTLEADVTLREPVVEISTEFPDVIREDEDVFIRLDGDNLPDFKKGLFTLEYDPDVLSFRSAELGEFFDDATAASIYYAEPNKQSGRAILALDSNTEVTELSGAGPLAYVKFKAKRDIESQEDTKLAMVMDTAARYVLDREGDNVLPVPVERTALRSAITAPPVQPDVTRETPLAEGGTPGPAGTTPGTTPGATGTTPGTGATGTIINPGAQAGQQQQQQSSVVPNQGGQVAVPGGVKPAGGTGAATAKPVSDIGADESGKAASSDGATGQKPVAPLTDGEASGPQMVGPMPPGAGTATDEDKAKEEEAKKQDAGGGLSGKSN